MKRLGIQDKVTLLPYALGEENKTVYFCKDEMRSGISENGDDAVEQKALDTLKDITIIGDALVKMDIEGSEMDALRGMKNFIKEKHPYLAICIYHRVTDPYEVAHYIKTLNPDYKLYIRGGWHLECWAVPSKK